MPRTWRWVKGSRTNIATSKFRLRCTNDIAKTSQVSLLGQYATAKVEGQGSQVELKRVEHPSSDDRVSRRPERPQEWTPPLSFNGPDACRFHLRARSFQITSENKVERSARPNAFSNSVQAPSTTGRSELHRRQMIEAIFQMVPSIHNSGMHYSITAVAGGNE